MSVSRHLPEDLYCCFYFSWRLQQWNICSKCNSIVPLTVKFSRYLSASYLDPRKGNRRGLILNGVGWPSIVSVSFQAPFESWCYQIINTLYLVGYRLVSCQTMFNRIIVGIRWFITLHYEVLCSKPPRHEVQKQTSSSVGTLVFLDNNKTFNMSGQLSIWESCRLTLNSALPVCIALLRNLALTE